MHSACSAPTHAKRVNARFDKVQKSNNEEKCLCAVGWAYNPKIPLFAVSFLS